MTTISMGCYYFAGHSCSKEEFQCENLQCIKSVLRCDGDLNCLDGSDEENCQCLNGQFSCSSGKCLAPEKLRDGKQDCVDGQDEKKGGGKMVCAKIVPRQYLKFSGFQ